MAESSGSSPVNQTLFFTGREAQAWQIPPSISNPHGTGGYCQVGVWESLSHMRGRDWNAAFIPTLFSQCCQQLPHPQPLTQ